MQGRITFPDNPWPAGHAVQSIDFYVHLHETEGACLGLSLKSEDYYVKEGLNAALSEAEQECENDTDLSDWQAKGAWANYHACSIIDAAPAVGVPLHSSGERISLRHLEDLRVHADPVEALDADWNFDDRAFSIYLLGHDAVCDHRFWFRKSDHGFAIHWTGKIALAYSGDLEWKHEFCAEIQDVPFGGFRRWEDQNLRASRSLKEREAMIRDIASRTVEGCESMRFTPGEQNIWDRLDPD